MDQTEQIDEANEMGRPAFLRWLSGAGLGLVAATATRLARPRPASAHPSCPEGFVKVGCCCLSPNVWPACPDACPGERSRQWTCCQGGKLVACFECTLGESCYDGPHLCSASFDVGSGC